MKLLFWGLSLMICAVGGLWMFGPREPVVTDVQFDASNLNNGIDPWLSAQEARFDDITDGVAKQVIWAAEPETKTDWAVVYIHGFSATSQEVRPLPDLVAQGLGANLVFTRLQGHGRTGDAMAEASVEGWMHDVAEALAIADRIGKKVLVIGTSTGATLAALALHQDFGKPVSAVVMISPNFRVKAPASQLLTWPAARWWLPLVAGADRNFTPTNDDHARFWTTQYPTSALLPMAASVQAARALAHNQATQPALFIFDDLDQVIDHSVTREIASNWGGPVTLHSVDTGPDGDPGRHVIAGRIMSPTQTQPQAEIIITWAQETQ
ncbi:MAG: alpha/beta hydrolase [Pelagimonas sp.]|uniref:alpha/beta hydrolase n=1 Tax=Pelagimonas sp. TaxID=2073170 RepID=UPI003D6AF0C7